MKKALVCILCLALCLSSLPCAFADEGEAIQAAWQLYDLGLNF